MLNITSIKSRKEENLEEYSMRIYFDKSLSSIDRILTDSVVQGVTLEYAYSHYVTLIPIGDGTNFWDIGPNRAYITYKFRTNLNALKDLAGHIKYLIDDIDDITIHAI